MMLFFPKRFSLDRLIVHSFAMSVAILTLGFVFSALLWLCYGKSIEQEDVIPLYQTSNKKMFPGELIGQGPLSLRPSSFVGWVSSIGDQLQLLSYNSRPDQLPKETSLVFQLKQDKQIHTTQNGKVIFLKELSEGKGLQISDTPSDLWIKPILIDGMTALVEAGRGQAGEKGQFITNFQGTAVRYPFSPQECVVPFKNGTAFSNDLVIHRYGGKEFSGWNQKVCLELRGKEGSYALRVSAEDYLIYKNGEWEVCSFDQLKKECPIGQVTSVSERGVEIVLWDNTGLSPWKGRIDLKKIQRPPFGAEALPANPQFRTASQITASFGKKRLILKPGDWLIRGQSGWRHMRTLTDLPLYLQRRLIGDLFVFEGIEKDAQGKSTLKGMLFDESRTYMQPVNVPISSDKTKSSKRKGKPHRGMK
ncbi:MAG: hypothetical protein RLZZ453_748 [Chlamydiota bacterium]|jgi:hypothetical protein